MQEQVSTELQTEASLQPLFERSHTILFQKEEAQKKVLYKLLKQGSPTPYELAAFYNEFYILQSIQIDGIRSALKQERVEGNYAIVLEYVPGDSLANLSLGRGLDLKEILEVALEGARILGELHKARVVHHDIKPSNFIYDKDTGKLNLIDFGLATTFEITTPYSATHSKLCGSLGYISPEQTGRMNRHVDYRSDLYSFGATLYHLLSGAPPFTGQDSLELVHAHVALEPRLLHQFLPEVPEALSKLVQTLLAKNQHDRYQSALGLYKDLQILLEQFGSLSPTFQLPQKNIRVTLNFQISEKLYGRNEESLILKKAVDSSFRGVAGVVLVEGDSGAGKTALIQELGGPIEIRKGYFLKGKFEELQKNIPYFALNQAFQRFVEILNASSHQELQEVKQAILEGVGELGQVLVEFIPSLKPILGELPPVPLLEGAEDQNRLKYVFRTFVQSISRVESPLVLFLDDMQWADSASADLLASLFLDQKQSYILLICAYRSEKISSQNPFIKAIHRIEENLVSIFRVQVKNLLQADISLLCQESLFKSEKEVEELSSLVYTKTQGNPFFTKEFLKTLYMQKILYLDFDSATWHCNLVQASALGISQNVLDFLVDRAKRLSQENLQILQFASCIGVKFSLQHLCMVTAKPVEEVSDALVLAIQEGVILAEDNLFRLAVIAGEISNDAYLSFAHDRLQQAIYEMMDAEKLHETHYKVGCILVESLEGEDREQQIFAIVNQFNQSTDLMLHEEELFQLAKLNFEAGEKAKSSAAFSVAFEYFNHAARLLAVERKSSDYEFYLSVLQGNAETAYLSGHFDQVEDFTTQIFSLAQSPREAISGYMVLVMTAIAQNELETAVKLGVQALQILGVKFPENPKVPHIILNLLKTKGMLWRLSIPQIRDLPQMEDEDMLIAMRFLQKLTPAAFRVGTNYFPLIVFRQVQLSLKYGNTPPSMFGYAAYGIALCAVLGDLEQGYKFGQLSEELTSHVRGGETFQPHVIFVHNNFLRHWKEPILSYLDDFMLGYQRALETGYLFEAAWLAHHRVLWGFYHGRSLARLQGQLEEVEEIFQKDQAAQEMVNLLLQVFKDLRDEEYRGQMIQGEFYDETREYNHAPTEACQVYLAKMLLAYLFENLNQAYEYLRKLEASMDAIAAMPAVSLIHFYGSLIRLQRLVEQHSGKDLKEVQKSLKNLKKWSALVPATHLHRVYLVEGLLFSVTGKTNKSHELFELAIQEVRQHQNYLEEGVVFEAVAHFYDRRGQKTFIRPLVEFAISSFRHAGMTAKVCQLEERFSKVLLWQKQQFQTHTESTQTASQQGGLDLLAVVKASQYISGEIQISGLLDKLMKTVLETAGAQRVCLFLEHRGQLLLEAEYQFADGQAKPVKPSLNPKTEQAGITMNQYEPVPHSILNYVIRTREDVVLANAAESSQFESDAYIQKVKATSVMCMPIHYHNKLTAILYLENPILVGAFTQGHLDVLRLISTQVAISIENANLYQSVEKKVIARTAELNNVLRDVQYKNQQIQSSISYAKGIQSSLLPDVGILKSVFQDYFLLWEPRDLVGGDIYFVEPSADGFLIILADCTGHGVPGAFMTMVVGSSLKPMVKGASLTDPALLLTDLNQVIQGSMHRPGMLTGGDDGLDAAVCYVDVKQKTLTFAGARLPLFYTEGKRVKKIAGDRQSIGYQSTPKDCTFTNHTIHLQGDQTFYLSSDGYWDQTGGSNGFSYGEKKFLTLLEGIMEEPFEEQPKKLRRALLDYQGSAERRDDVTVMGFQF